jgi:hypothetical protein
MPDIFGYLILAAVIVAMWGLQNRAEHLFRCRNGCIGHWRHGDRNEKVYYGEKEE